MCLLGCLCVWLLLRVCCACVCVLFFGLCHVGLCLCVVWFVVSVYNGLVVVCVLFLVLYVSVLFVCV